MVRRNRPSIPSTSCHLGRCQHSCCCNCVARIVGFQAAACAGWLAVAATAAYWERGFPEQLSGTGWLAVVDMSSYFREWRVGRLFLLLKLTHYRFESEEHVSSGTSQH